MINARQMPPPPPWQEIEEVTSAFKRELDLLQRHIQALQGRAEAIRGSQVRVGVYMYVCMYACMYMCVGVHGDRE
jgi:hypothetical protein